MIYNGQTAINHAGACTRVSILIIQHLLCAISIIKGGRERVKVKLPFATVRQSAPRLILFPEICFRDSSCNNFCHSKFCVTCKSCNCLRVRVVTFRSFVITFHAILPSFHKTETIVINVNCKVYFESKDLLSQSFVIKIDFQPIKKMKKLIQKRIDQILGII